MIFSVSAVCLAYLLGVVVCAFYIRNLSLVGAGFFWLFNSIAISFAFLSFIASSDKVHLLSALLFVLASIQLAYSIVQRNTYRKKPLYYENILYVLVIGLVVLTLVLIANQDFSGWPLVRESLRLLFGGLLLGGVTSAMLLGHWYLVQPGLTRKPIDFLCRASMLVLGIDIFLWLLSPSMISVLKGTVSDGWGGTLGYMWVGSCLTTAALLFVARKALQEKSYSAVMATTGLLYLAILVANGVELIPRAIFA